MAIFTILEPFMIVILLALLTMVLLLTIVPLLTTVWPTSMPPLTEVLATMIELPTEVFLPIRMPVVRTSRPILFETKYLLMTTEPLMLVPLAMNRGGVTGPPEQTC